MEYDCGFTKEDKWFRYRAAAIIIEEGYVLFAGNERENYFYSIGGAVHMGESAEEAVKREVFEETGVKYEVERLAFIHENFFEGDGSLEANHIESMKSLGYDFCGSRNETNTYFLFVLRGENEISLRYIHFYIKGEKEFNQLVGFRDYLNMYPDWAWYW